MIKLKNPILFVLFFIFSVLNISDIITTQFVLKGESNPIYLMTGSLLLIIILKVLVTWYLWFVYRRNIFPNHFMYYIILVIMVMGSLVLGIAQYANITAILNPEVLQVAAQMPDKEKMINYSWFVGFFYVLPAAFCLITFGLYRWSLKHIKINKLYYKRKKWYQL